MAEPIENNKRQRIVLASASPRRRELLTGMGYEFEICVSDADENIEGAPCDIVGLLARRKAEAVRPLRPNAVIIAADTLVSRDDCALGKPKSAEEAVAMLRSLSGRTHSVYTGLCVVDGAADTVCETTVRSDVTFRTLSDEEIAAYVASGEHEGKAGGYAIQGAARRFVSAYVGSLSNIIGLPTEALAEILKKIGF